MLSAFALVVIVNERLISVRRHEEIGSKVSIPSACWSGYHVGSSGPPSEAYTAARSDARSTAELAEKARADAAERASFDPFFTFFQGAVAAFEAGRRVGAVGVSGLQAPGLESR